jgi:hypothetical protein
MYLHYAVEKRDEVEQPCSDPDSSLTLPPILANKDGGSSTRRTSHTVTFPFLSPENSSPLHKDNPSTAIVEEDSNANTTLHDVTLPGLVENRYGCDIENSSHSVTKEDTVDAPTSIFDRLEQIEYSEQEDSDTESDDITASGEDDSEEGSDDSDDTNLNIPDLEPVTKLSWPTILQYVKESESQINKYFSLDNKDVVDARTEQAKEMLQNTKEATFTGNFLKQSAEMEVGALEKDGSSFCHFCGRKLPRRSLLDESQDIEKLQEQV